jgi:hypothetical protein
VGVQLIEKIKREMTGRIANERDNVLRLLETVEKAGDGNYLEIGVLHGGTLCAVGLLKEELGQRGECWGVDPLNGYYIEMSHVHKRGCAVDPITKLPVNERIVTSNIEAFNLENRCYCIKAKSDELPGIVGDKKFAVTYIDGDHWNRVPYQDFLRVKDITDRFIVFDNADIYHPDVLDACLKAATDLDWMVTYYQDITCIIARLTGIIE